MVKFHYGFHYDLIWTYLNEGYVLFISIIEMVPIKLDIQQQKISCSYNLHVIKKHTKQHDEIKHQPSEFQFQGLSISEQSKAGNIIWPTTPHYQRIAIFNVISSLEQLMINQQKDYKSNISRSSNIEVTGQ